MPDLKKLDDPQQRVVNDVQVLWPYLNINQRWDWAERLTPWFGSFTAAVHALTPNPDNESGASSCRT